MITLAESGLTSDQYDAIKTGYVPSGYKVIAHRLNPKFVASSNLVTAGGTAPFSKPVKLGANMIVADAASKSWMWNGSAWSSAVGVWASTITPHLCAYADGSTVVAYWIESGAIKRSETTNGTSWSAATTPVASVAGHTYTHVAGVDQSAAVWRVHYVAVVTANGLNHLRMATSTGGAFSVTSSDVYYYFPVDAFEAIHFDGDDALFLETEVPGNWSAENVDLDTTAEQYWEQTVALISFKVNLTTNDWGHHSEIDRAIRLNNPDDLEGVYATEINSKVYVSTWSTVGVASQIQQQNKFYQSVDADLYTLPKIINLPSQTGIAGLVTQGSYIWAVSSTGEFWIGDLTLDFGYENVSLKEDISAHIVSLGLDRGDILAGEFTMDNGSGYFDAHFLADNENNVLVDVYGKYLVDGDLVDLFLSRLYIESIGKEQESQSKVITVTARDITRNLTDQVVSEDAKVYDGGIDLMAGLEESDWVVLQGAFVGDATLDEHRLQWEAYSILYLPVKQLTNYSVDAPVSGSAIVHITGNNSYLSLNGCTTSGGIVVPSGAVYWVYGDTFTIMNSPSGGVSGFGGGFVVKYGLLYSNIVNPSYIIVTGRSAIDGKYYTETCVPLSGYLGAYTVYTGVIHITEPKEPLNLESTIDWYASKSGVVAELTTNQNTVTTYNETIPVKEQMIVTAYDSVLVNLFDGDTSTYVDVVNPTVGAYTTIGRVDIPALANYLEIDYEYTNSLSFDLYIDDTAGSHVKLFYDQSNVEPNDYVIRGGIVTYRWEIFASNHAVGIGRYLKIRVFTRPSSSTLRIRGIRFYVNVTKDVTLDALASRKFTALMRPFSTDVNQLFPSVHMKGSSTFLNLGIYEGSVDYNHSDTIESLVYIFGQLNARDGDIYLTYMVRNQSSTNNTSGFTGSLLLKTGESFSDILLLGFENIEVSSEGDVFDAATLDPGESPIGGISRVIDGRYMRQYTRYDGTVKFYYPTTRTEDFAFPLEEVNAIEYQYDKRSIYSHVRMLGAYVEGEYIDAALLESIGHKFMEANNPYLLSEGECVLEAKRTIRRMKQSAETLNFNGPYIPFLEPEDRISLEGYGDWLIDAIGSISFEAGYFSASYNCRRYLPDA